MADDATKSGPREAIMSQAVHMVKSQGIFCVFFCVSMYFCYTIVIDLRAANKEMTDGFRKIAVDSAVSMDKNTAALTQNSIVIGANTSQAMRVERVLERIERKQVEAAIPYKMFEFSSRARTAPIIESTE